MTSESPFTHPLLAHWLYDLFYPGGPSGMYGPDYWSEVGRTSGVPRELALIGEGPLKHSDLIAMLVKHDVLTLRIPDATVEVLVVGTDGWHAAELDEQVRLRQYQALRVYSQEMFLTHVVSLIDPFEEADLDVLHAFGEGHPALSYLMKRGFDWPTTMPTGAAEHISDFGREVGMLKYMGYRVGKTGMPAPERRAVLRRVFELPLPRPKHLFSHDYVDSWGDPRTQGRLREIAYEIARFAKDRRAMRNPPWAAIEDWEDDLEWLRIQFHDGGWRWPSG